MKKENCTKGPVYIGSTNDMVYTARADGGIVVVAGTNKDKDNPSRQEIVENTRLIAEAFNVLHETGCTPRELADKLHEYRELLAVARLVLYTELDGCSGNAQHFYTNRLKRREDLERDPETGEFFPISKHQPKTHA